MFGRKLRDHLVPMMICPRSHNLLMSELDLGSSVKTWVLQYFLLQYCMLFTLCGNPWWSSLSYHWKGDKGLESVLSEVSSGLYA